MLIAPPPIPTGEEVETIAVALAAVEGYPWRGLSREAAQRYRRLANAAIMRLGAGAEHIGSRQLQTNIDQVVVGLRDAARELEDRAGDGLLRLLYSSATKISDVGAVLAGIEDPGEDF